MGNKSRKYIVVANLGTVYGTHLAVEHEADMDLMGKVWVILCHYMYAHVSQAHVGQVCNEL